MTGKKGMVHYPEEVRREAVRMAVEEGKTYREITQLLNMRDPQRVIVWVHDYRYKKDEVRRPKGRPRKVSGQAESLEEEVKRLWMENDLLKKIHAELRKMELAKRDIG